MPLWSGRGPATITAKPDDEQGRHLAELPRECPRARPPVDLIAEEERRHAVVGLGHLRARRRGNHQHHCTGAISGALQSAATATGAPSTGLIANGATCPPVPSRPRAAARVMP